MDIGKAEVKQTKIDSQNIEKSFMTEKKLESQIKLQYIDEEKTLQVLKVIVDNNNLESIEHFRLYNNNCHTIIKCKDYQIYVSGTKHDGLTSGNKEINTKSFHHFLVYLGIADDIASIVYDTLYTQAKISVKVND